MNVSANSAQLWLGPANLLNEKVIHHLRTIFCPNQGCTRCTNCRHIAERTHYSCLWLTPDNFYTLEMLKPFFTHIARSLDLHEKFYFIFERADYLSIACTNSLLKSVEEPPPGYHMIFLAHNVQNVAPTLRSRCIVFSYNDEIDPVITNPLVPFFTEAKAPLFEQFLQAIDLATLDERFTMTALEHIMNFWVEEYKKNSAHHQALKKIEILKESFEKLPMQGSAKIFWKNLFLRML